MWHPYKNTITFVVVVVGLLGRRAFPRTGSEFSSGSARSCIDFSADFSVVSASRGCFDTFIKPGPFKGERFLINSIIYDSIFSFKARCQQGQKSWLPAGSYFGNLNLVVVEPVFGSSLSGESAEGEQRSDWFFWRTILTADRFFFCIGPERGRFLKVGTSAA